MSCVNASIMPQMDQFSNSTIDLLLMIPTLLNPEARNIYFFVVVVTVPGGGTLWHLQKFLQIYHN
jgi:hypothetical protein